MYSLHQGKVFAGHGMASGRSVATPDNWFPDSTLKLQQPYFAERGFDYLDWVPAMHWGTINVALEGELVLGQADVTLEKVDWTIGLPEKDRIAAETFSFVRCALCHAGHYYPALLYYPHPETKPPEVEHRYDVLEVLAAHVPGLAYGDCAAIACRADAFLPRGG